ncbi:MAG TPA: FAD-dependent oxidoreductase, partial [Tepidisphaeraceae bacterium]|nr:FAD-dependent oxidoreductase [Tepidisphaeraceae bacterium]
MPTQKHVVPTEVASLPEGQMKEVTLGETKVLLARVNGTLHAVAAACPHYGMPLAEGLLCGSMLRCAWHQSTFDITTGKLLEPPALDGLATYPISVEDGQVIVTIPEAPTTPPAAPQAASDTRTFVILGAGAAGTAAAQALRDLGFGGRVVLVTAERDQPYDRPNLSKEFLAGQIPADYLPLRPELFYTNANITLLHQRADAIDPAGRTIHFADGSTVTYDKLLLATGAEPRQLTVPGAELANVQTLRSRADCDRLIAAATSCGVHNVVVIGASFIGMEVAAALRERKLDVTVVTPDAVPFQRVLGPEVGGFFQRLHERHGVHFRLNARVDRLDGDHTVRQVTLAAGEQLPAQLVVVGIGVRPATDLLPAQWRDDRGAIPVDEFLRVRQAQHVFAAGDIARYPDPRGDGSLRIEHWRVAEQQGRLAARNMLRDAAEPFVAVPYFWSFQFGVGLDYVGHAGRWDRVQIDGNLAAADFTAYYVRDNRVIAASSCGRSRQMSALLEIMKRD